MAFKHKLHALVNDLHGFVWLNASNVDDVGIVFVKPKDHRKIRQAIAKHHPESFGDLLDAIETEGIKRLDYLSKTWGENNENFDCFELDLERRYLGGED